MVLINKLRLLVCDNSTQCNDRMKTKLRRFQQILYRYSEWRAIFEFQSFYALKPLMQRFAKGDGHPVLFLPGFGGSDLSTAPMRKLLQDLGYQTYGWGLGRNLAFDDDLEKEMVALLDEIHEKHGRKVSMVGWSLGGLYAREIAKVRPEAVRQVISLGSPISGRHRHTDARHLYRALNGPPSSAEQVRRQALNAPPPVPTTSIYTKTDGIVAWEGSVQRRYQTLQALLNCTRRSLLPDESVVSAGRGVAVAGGNVETSQRLADALLRALGRSAASQGTMNNLTVSTAAGSWYETIAGGAGAGPGRDGRDAVQIYMTNTRSTDVELLERRFPVVLRALRLRRGSGGCG